MLFIWCFNTASGKYCCNIAKDARKARLGMEGFNTASGKYCCNVVKSMCYVATRAVSIPQAVSTVATVLNAVVESKKAQECFNTASGKYCCNRQKNVFCSLPATGFNTASGKYCCNCIIAAKELLQEQRVSIPQAVSTVATAGSEKPVFMRSQKVVLENLKP